LKKVFMSPSSSRLGLGRPQRIGAQFLDFADESGDDFGKPGSLGGRHPLYSKALRVDPLNLENRFGCSHPGQCFVITFQVMTVSQVSPHDHNAVYAFVEGVHDQVGMDHAGAVHPDHPQVGGILEPGDPGQVGPGISAPVAKKSENDWFKIL
jgi:hypothetical protein